jgi:protein TonB
VLSAPAPAAEEIKAGVVESPAEEIVAVAEPASEPEAKSKIAGSKKGLLAVLAIALIAAAGYFAWTQWQSWKKPAGVPVVVPVRPATPPAPPAQTLVKPDASSALAPSAQSLSSQLPPSASAPASSSAPATVPAVGETKPHPKKELNSSDPPAPTANPAKTKTKSSILMPAKAKPAQLDADAPSINTIVASNNPSLPNLALGAARAPTPVLASKSGFTQGVLIKQVPPQYPSKAMQMNIDGSVQLLATVSKKGDVSAVKILSGNAALSAAASDAVRQWKYKPFLLNGDPVEIQVPVTVKFKLP